MMLELIVFDIMRSWAIYCRETAHELYPQKTRLLTHNKEWGQILPFIQYWNQPHITYAVKNLGIIL